jgi:hypothetical protein
MKCLCKKDFKVDLSQMQIIFFKENCEYEYKTTPHEETGIPIYYLDVLKSTTGWDWFPFSEEKFKLNFKDIQEVREEKITQILGLDI